MKLLIAIVVWLSMLVGLLWYSGSGQLSHFSPNSAPIDIIKIKNELIQLNAESGPLLVHIFDPKCRCNLVAKAHVESVKRLGESQLYQNIEINIEDHPKWVQLIPSTPAVIAIRDQEITYLGPYSTGISCLPGEGLIEPYINQQNQPPLIKTDGYGCYCNH